MTERENALLAYHHQKPEWTPLSWDSVYHCGFAGGNENGLISEDRCCVFGVKWIISNASPTPDPDEPYMLEEIEDWREVIKFPEPYKWDWEAIAKQELAGYDDTKVLSWFSEMGMFDRLATLGGFENALCWLLTDPEETSALLGRIADYKIELIECVAKYIKPDVFMYTDDLATARGLFMSPEVYRSVIKPHHERIIKAIKDNNMIAEQHTCGKCEEIIPDFVEMGVESFFPAQAINDLVGIQEKYGDKLTLLGGFDSQKGPGKPDCSDEEIMEEAHRIIDSYSDAGGFICMPMIMDVKGNWALYEQSHRQKLFREEFYRYDDRQF